MKRQESVDNIRVIAGIFRESIFGRIDARVDSEIDALIIGLEENDRRSHDIERSVTLVLAKARQQSKPSLSLEIFCKESVVTCEAKVLSEEGPRVKVRMPDTLNVTNRRAERRVEPKFSEMPRATGVVEDRGRYYEVSFHLCNISRYGMALSLEVDVNFEIPVGARIIGSMNTASGNIDVTGSIVQTRVEAIRGDLKEVFIRIVRTKKDAENTHEVRSLSVERRSIKRQSFRTDLQVRTVLVPKVCIDLEIFEVSVAGFAARCKNTFFLDYLIPGIPARIENSTLMAEIVHSALGIVHCQFIAGSEADRIWWLKRISPAIAEPTHAWMPDATRLLGIFCSSGAFSSDFIKSQRLHLDMIVANIEQETDTSSYIHRWIDRNETSPAVGHISCIRMGDNAWFVSDLVKSSDPEAIFSEDFVRKFLHSFAHVSLSMRPVPRIMFIWVVKHPYWANFEAKLNQLSSPEVLSATIGYIRTAPLGAAEANPKVVIREIDGGDYRAINGVLDRLGDFAVVEIARSFDLDIDRFGSPRLAEKIDQQGGVFWRRYYEIETPHVAGVAVITALPDGMNLNRVIDAAWFFEYGKQPISEPTAWQEIVLELKRIAAEHGLSLPGVRRVASHQMFSPLLGEHAEMRAVLVHPSMLFHFE